MMHAVHKGVLFGHLREQQLACAHQGQHNLLLQLRPVGNGCQHRQVRLLDATRLVQSHRRGSAMWLRLQKARHCRQHCQNPGHHLQDIPVFVDSLSGAYCKFATEAFGPAQGMERSN